MHFSSPQCAVHAPLNSSLPLVTLIIFHDAYKLCSCLSCIFLQPPAAAALLGQNITVSTCSPTIFVCILTGDDDSNNVDGDDDNNNSNSNSNNSPKTNSERWKKFVNEGSCRMHVVKPAIAALLCLRSLVVKVLHTTYLSYSSL
jgi:hypothetical protein